MRYSIPVLVLKAGDNTYTTLKRLVPPIRKMLQTGLKPGPTEITEEDGL
jgi:hypothetical protein